MIKIALAVPYKGFIENAYQIFRQHNEFYRAVDQENYEMEEVIVTSENVNQIKIEADIVLTRGLLAEILASLSKDIPVVEITVPAADILRTIRNCVEHYGKQKIGIIAAGNMLDGITELSDLSEAPIRTFVLTPDWNNEMLVKRAVSEGCKVILGGVNTCRYAAENHVSFMMIQTSQEAFWNALSDVKRTWSIFRKEQEKALRLQALLDISHDGILLIDPDFKLTAMNRKAQSVLGIDGEHLPVDALSLGGELKDVLAGDEEYVNRLVQYGSNMLNVSKNVLKIQSSICGYVVNVQAVKEIQSMEHDIRKRICKKGHIARYRFDDITGESPVMISTVETARRYSRTSSNILLIGQSGTGKEMFAQSIHNDSQRRRMPFVAVNCAAIPEQLLESELFGYAPGAFTGAHRDGKAGLFELAHKGTLFLDEIGEISLTLQAKLLRVLQEREIMRVGGDSVIPVDIRILAATNQNLEQLAAERQFREDLLYRLDVLRINIPSLNQRREDISLLADSYMRRAFPDIRITDEAKAYLEQMDWPGNVRQLFNFCERLAVLCNGFAVDADLVAAVSYREESRLGQVQSSLVRRTNSVLFLRPLHPAITIRATQPKLLASAVPRFGASCGNMESGHKTILSNPAGLFLGENPAGYLFFPEAF